MRLGIIKLFKHVVKKRHTQQILTLEKTVNL